MMIMMINRPPVAVPAADAADATAAAACCCFGWGCPCWCLHRPRLSALSPLLGSVLLLQPMLLLLLLLLQPVLLLLLCDCVGSEWVIRVSSVQIGLLSAMSQRHARHLASQQQFIQISKSLK